MSSRPKNPKYARNKNVIVIGGSGSGKTRGYVKPNLMQCESSTYPVSFVVTDPKMTVSQDNDWRDLMGPGVTVMYNQPDG